MPQHTHASGPVAGRSFILTSWRLASTEALEASGQALSAVAYDDSLWQAVRVPSTVLGALVEGGQYTDLFVGDNLARIPRERFSIAWWYRTRFDLTAEDLRNRFTLAFDGINYRANIWLNGRLLAGEAEVHGAFKRFCFDVTAAVRTGRNILAVEVFPPRPGDYSTGFVDWNPAPPDGNMGLFRPVILRRHGPVSIDSPFVESRLLDGGRAAELTIRARLKNHADTRMIGALRGEAAGVPFQAGFSLSPGEVREVAVSPEQEPALRVENPVLWWPAALGEPHLHRLDLRVEVEGWLADETHTEFGIREVSDHFTEEGHRGFRINGKHLLILGAGWTDDLLLREDPERVETQLRYVLHLGLNTVRLEGIWGSSSLLYESCDRLGILLMVGWSCHWEHEQYLGKPADDRYGGILAPGDVDLVASMWEDQLLWLRRHPSIFTWAVGSDKMPSPELERRYLDTFERIDTSRPVLISTAGFGSDAGVITQGLIESELTGPSGMKMLGPYDYTPPVYWYTDTARGGAFGFNTETGPGAQPAVLESIKRMIPENHHWPIDAIWNFHCARNEFDRLDRFVEAMTHRLGAPEGLEDFDRKAQLLNYELMRPMVEAFRVHRGRATGLIHWMLNSAWPSLYWQLFGHDLTPNAAYYATRKATRPLHLVYEYGRKAVCLVHDGHRPPAGLSTLIRIYSVLGEEVSRFESPVPAETAHAIRVAEVPDPPGLASWFLDARLMGQAEEEIDRSVYWLSAQPDVLDYAARVEPWPFHTPSSGFAAYPDLRSMPTASVEAVRTDVDGGRLAVTLRNTGSAPAFFVEVVLLESVTGRRIVPIFWDDNYIWLLPRETVTLRANGVPTAAEPAIEVRGWNLSSFRVPR